MTTIQIPAAELELAEGETYAGVVLGEAPYHLVLLPGDQDYAPLQVQLDWAKSIGGELPNRRELGLLRVNAPEEFKDDWYWSGELYEPDSSSAWCQYFGDGLQVYNDTYGELRARAVRRSAF